MLATLPCHLSLITIHISDSHQFSDIQGVVGYLNMSLLQMQIYYWVCQWKNLENRLIFGEVMGKSLVSCFFDSMCIKNPVEKQQRSLDQEAFKDEERAYVQ